MPFRIWYSKLVELKSLLPSAKYAIFTATSTKLTKMTLFDMLELTPQDTFCIEKSPVRSNICYCFCYMDKTLELETVFNELIDEINIFKHETKRTIIFCQTRKQCSLLYRMFVLAIGKSLYAFGKQDPAMQILDMFHSGSPKSVKEHIIREIGRFGSHLRIIICTIAFGMGIDCKDTYRSIHFGPPKTVESLVQESGRIGRDGKQCFSYVLHNGLLSSHCNCQMKQLMHTKSCKREFIVNLFCVTKGEIQEKNCMCCTNCALLCQCNDPVQTMEFGTNSSERSRCDISVKTRPVSDAQQRQLHEKLLAYRKTLIPKTVTEFMPVGPPNVFFEFGQFQIDQVLNNCKHLFTMADILEHVEIWRYIHANNIFFALNETFGDMDKHDIPLLSEEEFHELEILPEDWEAVRDDSNLNELQSGTLSFLNTSVEDSLNDAVTSEHNMSEIFAGLAIGVEIHTPEYNE